MGGDDTTDRDSPAEGSDPSADWAELRAELVGPGMRWLTLALGAAACGLLCWWASAGSEPVVYFPFHLRGTAAWVVVGAAAAGWVGSAVRSWAWWLRGERPSAEPGAAADRGRM